MIDQRKMIYQKLFVKKRKNALQVGARASSLYVKVVDLTIQVF